MAGTLRLSAINLQHEWDKHYWQPGRDEDWFLNTHLPTLLRDPTEAQKVFLCRDCGVWHTKLRGAGAKEIAGLDGQDRWVCRSCLSYLTACAGCGAMDRNHMRVDGQRMCVPCRDARYFHCRNCGAYYPLNQEDQHRHGADSCCSSPMQEFIIPFRGKPLANDSRGLVTLDSGVVSPLGLMHIRDYLQAEAKKIGRVDAHDKESRQYRLYMFARSLATGAVGNEVVNKSGTFATRVKRAAYKDWKLKIEPEILTQVGNLVAKHSSGGDYHFEVTRDLNKPSSQFGNQGSCWWTDYKGSRCALKNNGGFGLRVFGSATSQGVTGRVWVLPLKADVDGVLGPTFSTKTGIWFVFNGYGTLSGSVGPRVVSAILGDRPHQEVTYPSDRGDGMYINNNMGSLVADPKILKRYKTALNVPLTQHSELFQREQRDA